MQRSLFCPTLAILTTCLFLGCGEAKVEAPTTDLHTAVTERDLATVNQHIAAESDLDVRNELGSTPLDAAVALGETNIAKALINAGADINAKNNDESPIIVNAAFFCRTEIVQALLDAGVNKDAKNRDGATALDISTLPWEAIKPIYDLVGSLLSPATGIQLDYDRIQATRPQIAEMLR